MTDRGRDTRDGFGKRLVDGLKDMRAYTMDRKRYDLTSGKTRGNSVIFPPCSMCGGQTVSSSVLRSYWDISGVTLWKWVNGHGILQPAPYQDARYVNNPITNRAGTHGITQRAFCIDRVNIWALMTGRKPAKSWLEVQTADGTIAKLPPKPKSSVHIRKS